MFTRYWASVIADRLGTTLNNNEDRVAEVIYGLNHTKGFCPCVPKYLHSKDTLCPCKEMRENGICHCEIFKDRT